MALHITIDDVNPSVYQKMKIFPHHRESRIEIIQITGKHVESDKVTNTSRREEVIATFWFKNEDMKKVIQTLDLEDLS